MAKTNLTKFRPRSVPAAEALKRTAARADRDKDKKLSASETKRVKGAAGEALREAVNVAGRFEQFPNTGFEGADSASLDEVKRVIDREARSLAQNKALGVGPQTKGQQALEVFEQSMRRGRK